MKAFLIALAVAQVGGTCVEFLTRPRAPLLARCTAAVLLRAAVFAFVFAFFFAISWRPAFAAAGTIVFTAVFVAISRARRHQMPARSHAPRRSGPYADSRPHPRCARGAPGDGSLA